MKEIFVISIFTVIAQVTQPQFHPIATLDMDGLGHYVVDNYEVHGKCIDFKDVERNPIHFCGAYSIKAI